MFEKRKDNVMTPGLKVGSDMIGKSMKCAIDIVEPVQR